MISLVNFLMAQLHHPFVFGELSSEEVQHTMLKKVNEVPQHGVTPENPCKSIPVTELGPMPHGQPGLGNHEKI